MIRFPQSIRARSTRTRHGEEALILEESIKIDLYNYDAKKFKMELKQGTILFLSDNGEFKHNDVIGEVSARGNLITERATKDLVTNISGEVYFSDLLVEEKIDRQGNITLTTSQGGLIWLLAGDVYTIPTTAEICVESNQFVRTNDVLAKIGIISDYGGTVRLSDSTPDEIQIITASTSIEDSFIGVSKDTSHPETPYFLQLKNGKQFIMHCSPGNKLTNSLIFLPTFNRDSCITSLIIS